MSAPARQVPMIHGVQLVRPSRLCSGISSCLSACSWSFDPATFGGIRAYSAGNRVGWGGQLNYGVNPWLPEALRAFWPFAQQRRHAQLLFSLGLLLSCFSSSPELGQELLGPSLFPALPPSVGSPSSFIV